MALSGSKTNRRTPMKKLLLIITLLVFALPAHAQLFNRQIRDDAYSSAWDGDTRWGASRNSLYDALGSAAITSGTIDGAVIGATTPAAGTFTALTSNGIDDNADATAITIAVTTELVSLTNTADLASVTDLNIPYMSAAGAGFADSPLTTDGTDVDNTGASTATSYTADATATPSIAFTDSDGGDGDTSGQIYGNLSATGSGVEVFDFFWQAQGGAGTPGTMESFMDYDASNRALTVQGSLNSAPMTETVTTEADITDPITSSVVLIVGDDDTDNDAIDLQDGTTAGQLLHLIASAGVDANDTMTINYGDTTCTNCPVTVFDKVGENVSLIWTGATWVVTGLQSSL